MAGKSRAGKNEKLELLPGLNPDGVAGLVVRPTKDMAVYVAPERGLEVLDVLIGGRPVMYRNPAGHLSRRSFNPAGVGPLASIEGGFTSGLENAGPPDGPWPLHGTFSQTPASHWRRTASGGVRGLVDCRKLVSGPYITVDRSIEPVAGRRAFVIRDILQADLGSDYMWLYHPNFPVDNGTTFVSSERLIVPRPDNISKTGREDYRLYRRVGEGLARFPPSQSPASAIIEENFERCYIMIMTPDQGGTVRAALVAGDGRSASYVKYRPGDFQPAQQVFQLWKNPREGVSGLEVGNTFLGRTFATERGLLCHLRQGESHRYEIEIGFLGQKAEVDEFLRQMPKVARREIRLVAKEKLAPIYRGQAGR